MLTPKILPSPKLDRIQTGTNTHPAPRSWGLT